MGFWNWIFKKLSTGQGPEEYVAAKYGRRPSGGGVATLDRDEDCSSRSEWESDDDDTILKWWAPDGQEVLLDWRAPDRPDMTADARALEMVLISHFDGHDLTMPALLPIAEKALSQLRDSNCGLAEVAKTLSDDPVIAAGVLRMANSPLYRGIDKITALPPAVSRLGAGALKTLMMHESLRAAMAARRGGDVELADLVWRRSVAGATIMRGLSAFTHTDEEDAYLVGLLHDIGNIIVLRIVENQQKRTRELVDLHSFEYLCYECHQEFGELVAQAWKLPPSIASIVSDHHTEPAPDDPQHQMRLQLIVSDMISSLLKYAPYESYDLLNCRVVQELGLSERNDFLRFLRQLPDEINEAVGAL